MFSIDTTITLTAMTQIMEPTMGISEHTCTISAHFTSQDAEDKPNEDEGLSKDYTMWVVGVQDCYLNITNTRVELSQYCYDEHVHGLDTEE